MDQTAIEPQAIQPNPSFATRFNADNAREMSARGKIARQLRKNKPAPAPVIPTPAPITNGETLSDALRARVNRLDERIEAVLDAMETAETAKDQQALAMAFRALNDVWSLLTGHPRAGVRKDKPRRSIQTFATPLE